MANRAGRTVFKHSSPLAANDAPVVARRKHTPRPGQLELGAKVFTTIVRERIEASSTLKEELRSCDMAHLCLHCSVSRRKFNSRLHRGLQPLSAMKRREQVQ